MLYFSELDVQNSHREFVLSIFFFFVSVTWLKPSDLYLRGKRITKGTEDTVKLIFVIHTVSSVSSRCINTLSSFELGAQ